MDRDDEPPLDEDYYEPEMDPASYSYLDELAIEHVHEDTPAVAPEPLPAAMPATDLALQWLELFPQLPISGMTGSIAANCTLIAAKAMIGCCCWTRPTRYPVQRYPAQRR